MVLSRGRIPVAFEPLLHQEAEREFLRKLEKKDTNLIVINEECQFCGSTARSVACSRCRVLMCEECIEYLNAKPLCSCCLDDVENPRRLATVLIFPSAKA